MAIVRRLLRLFVKRLHTTLAVAQRIVRFLLSSWRDMRNVTETLLRSFNLPVEPWSIQRTVEEDKFLGASNNFIEEKAEILSSNLEIDNKEDNVMNSSSHCLIGKHSESISLLSTIMETTDEEDDTKKVHGTLSCPSCQYSYYL